MSNSYYNHSTYPTPNAPGSSAQLRAELDLVSAGFNKLPTLTGNGYKVAMINSAGTAIVASSDLQSLAISGSTIDNTPIGATTRAAGNFTTLSANGAVNLGTSVTIGGGTINNTPIGGTTASSGAFTTVSASSGFTGNLTGNVTGNVTGAVTGNVTGNLTGNVTANTGTSTFNNVTINGSLDMDAGSSATIINLSTPTNSGDAANKGYVDTQTATRLALAGGTMSGAIAMGGSKITGLGTPTADGDAATKAYVDGVAQGLDVKGSVRVATTTEIGLSGTQTIDGVSVIAGDRVLVKNQSATSANGVYVVAAGSWTRAADMDIWAEFPGAFFFVEEGTANDNSGWVCTVASGGTLGSTSVTFEQFSGAGQITAGTGMSKSGNTLNVGTASSSRIVVNADNIDLATTGVTADTYAGLTIDAYGRVTAATALTTLSGYGISNAYTKTEVDTTVATLLAKAGGTMSGAIAMGANKITGMADPTNAQDAATKAYTDSILGSATSAAASASAAATSATNAASSATAASGSASAAATSATNAAASYDAFDDRYLGSKTSDPTVDNDGNALLTGALYWNSSANVMKVYDGAAWTATYLPASGYLQKSGDTMTGNLNVLAALGVGISTLTGFNVRVNRNLTGAVQTYGVTSEGAVQSDSTTAVNMFYTAPSTAAASFTLGNLYHYRAVQGSVGAGSSITTQTGFLADSTLTGATTNYGFRGALPAAANRWNLYMDGTAANYLAGATTFADSTSPIISAKIGPSSSQQHTIPAVTSDTVALLAATQTLTNKRINNRISSTTSAATLTPDVSAYDAYAFTALAAGLTINAPTGTPVDGTKLVFRIVDNGTARALTWNATFTVIGVTLPTTTTVNKTTYVGCMYNAASTRWDVIAVTTQA